MAKKDKIFLPDAGNCVDSGDFHASHACRPGAESEYQRGAGGHFACLPANQGADGAELHVQHGAAEGAVARDTARRERDGGGGTEEALRRAAV